jgi:hypothetical protein
MNNLCADKNRRVLVIDDNQSIHDDFRKILSPRTATSSTLDATEAAIFGSSAEMAQQVRFEMDSAFQEPEEPSS